MLNKRLPSIKMCSQTPDAAVPCSASHARVGRRKRENLVKKNIDITRLMQNYMTVLHVCIMFPFSFVGFFVKDIRTQHRSDGADTWKEGHKS